MSEEAASGASVDLGEIAVNVALGPRVGEVVPELTFTDLAGKATQLSALRDRLVLVHFWATWCAPCVDNLPSLAQIRDRFGNDRLTILGVNLDDDPDQARAIVERKKLSWSQVYLGRSQDKDAILSRYAISSVPAYFLVGPDGKLIKRSESLKAIIEELPTHTMLRLTAIPLNKP